MVYTKTNPVGIDRAIQAMQLDLEANLNAIWGMSGSEYQCYGRAYRNQKQNGGPTDYVPEVFVGGNNFKQVTIDKRAKATSFFFVAENIPIDEASGQATATVSLIYFVNLAAVKPNITHRGDEEARRDVLYILNNTDFQMKAQITGIANVFKEFSGWKDIAGEKYRDMFPFHCFRFDTTIYYNPLEC